MLGLVVAALVGVGACLVALTSRARTDGRRRSRSIAEALEAVDQAARTSDELAVVVHNYAAAVDRLAVRVDARVAARDTQVPGTIAIRDGQMVVTSVRVKKLPHLRRRSLNFLLGAGAGMRSTENWTDHFERVVTLVNKHDRICDAYKPFGAGIEMEGAGLAERTMGLPYVVPRWIHAHGFADFGEGSGVDDLCSYVYNYDVLVHGPSAQEPHDLLIADRSADTVRKIRLVVDHKWPNAVTALAAIPLASVSDPTRVQRDKLMRVLERASFRVAPGNSDASPSMSLDVAPDMTLEKT